MTRETKSKGTKGNRIYYLSVLLLCTFILSPSFASLSSVSIIKDDPKGGFEIGNGRSWIENDFGKYKFALTGEWEIGFNRAFTEAIAPLSEGTPRVRVDINVERHDEFKTYEDFLTYWSNKGTWTEHKVGELRGLKREYLASGLKRVEVRLFREPGEQVLLNIPASMLVLLKSFQTLD